MDLGPESVIMVGYSANLMSQLDRILPVASVLVIDEPDVVARRRLSGEPERYRSISRVVPLAYQAADGVAGLTELVTGAAARAVLTGVEYGVTAAAGAAERLGLPGPGVVAARILTDKFRLRQVAASAGLHNPRYQLVLNAADAGGFVARSRVPCVVKPTSRHASLGVQRVHSSQEAVAAWTAAVAPEEAFLVPDRGIPSRVLAEEQMVGDECSVELLVREGETAFANVTAKHVLPGRHPVEVGHDVPAPYPARTIRALISATERLGRATGFRTGVLHAEWIIMDEGPGLVECAGRLPGDEIVRLIGLAYDTDLVEQYLLLLTGQPTHAPSAAVAAAAVRFLMPRPGRVTAVSGHDEARGVPGVREAVVDVTTGATVPVPRSSWDRAGHVTATAATLAQATMAAETALAQLRVRTTTASDGSATRP